jgi:OmcA/MtrC family decaheme c-type cytochrome
MRNATVATRCLTGLVILGGVALLSSASRPYTFTKWDRASYASPSLVGFVRPGFNIQIVSAKIAADGTTTVDYKITDPKGLGLDLAGIQTPGAITLSFLLASIPKGQKQYVTYATRTRTSADGKNTVTVATTDSGGKSVQIADGEYLYTFGNKAPGNFDPTATHRIAIFGNRNLTEFDLGTFYDDAVLDFVPGGGTPAPRDIVRTESCNRCHDQLSHHGGNRRSVELCVMCHTPQSTDANTNNPVNFPVMVHKIHMGSQLPSVKAGKPYGMGTGQATGGHEEDWSTVVFPADPRRCETCHDQKSGAAQADAYLKNPNRAACGACHDNVNFATGENHLNLPQTSDNQCSTCHIPQGELELDASIKGAHILPQESATRAGIVADIVKVDDGGPGQKPTVTFTLKDFAGNGIPASSLSASPNRVSLNLAGPTTDFGYTSFGSDVTTPGYVTENPAATAQCSPDGTCSYTFTHAIPAGAKGTYAVGIEARRGLTLLPGTVKETKTQYGAVNKIFYFSVDGSPIVKRRQVVDIAKCNGCHVNLSMHGGNRNQTVYCVFCHNPSNTDASKPTPQAVNFSLFIHKIHFGENLAAAGATYTVSGNDFTEVRFPVMNVKGTPGDTAKCYMCHVNGSEANFPIGLNDVKTPQGLMNPTPATTAACTACHVQKSATAHAVSQTDPTFGESCDVCHSSGAEFDVVKMHAGK